MAERDSGELYGDAHVKSYRETGGEFGHLWRGAPTLLLTTTGAKSGEPPNLRFAQTRRERGFLYRMGANLATDEVVARRAQRRSFCSCAVIQRP